MLNTSTCTQAVSTDRLLIRKVSSNLLDMSCHVACRICSCSEVNWMLQVQQCSSVLTTWPRVHIISFAFRLSTHALYMYVWVVYRINLQAVDTTSMVGHFSSQDSVKGQYSH